MVDCILASYHKELELSDLWMGASGPKRALTPGVEFSILTKSGVAELEIEEAREAAWARWETSCQLFATLPGADRLIAKYGKVPTFHDGEVEVVHLNQKGPSKIAISIPWPDIFGEEKVLVTLTAAHVLDVELEGFSRHNYVYELWFRRPTPQPGHAGKGISLEEGDVEVEFESTLGLGGKLLLRSVDVSWSLKRPGKSAKG
jgi:hypothetical protein